ncbi:MAG: FHA domain-containing protein [Desulfobacterales bacterium]|nr:FHA domain-containing protein [Desulfobacterales bacterium]
MPKITLKFKGNVLADYHLPLGCSLKIGRHKDNDVIIENLAVSGHHGKIDSAGDGFVYIDLKSKNGSFINEELVTSHWLADGDVINIGKHSLTFAYLDSESRPEDKQKSEMEQTMVMDTNEYRSMVGKSDPKLTMTVSPEAAPEPVPVKDKKKKSVRGYITYIVGGEGTLALKQKVTKIGKDTVCDIVIKGWKIGKTAATISRSRDGYFFSYVSGFAKPRINDKKTSKKPHKLNESDIISIGSAKLQFIGKKQKNKPPRNH